MPTVSTSAGRTPRSARSMAAVRSTASAVRSGLAQQFDKLVEERSDQGGLRRGPGRGDLVAAHVDVGVELPLNNVQQFVTGAEQADHRMISGYHDLHLRPRFALGPVFALPVAVGSAFGA